MSNEVILVKACARPKVANMSGGNIEALVQRLSSADSGMPSILPRLAKSDRLWRNGSLTFPLDVKVKVEAATQLRDNLDHYITGPIYPAFLKKLVPIFINCLKGPPVFISTSGEQVKVLLLRESFMLTYYLETTKLCARDPASSADKSSRSLRTICRRSGGPFDELGEM